MALKLELFLGVGNYLGDCFLASLLSVVSSNRDRTGIAGHQQQYSPNGCEVCHGRSSKFTAQDDLELENRKSRARIFAVAFATEQTGFYQSAKSHRETHCTAHRVACLVRTVIRRFSTPFPTGVRF